MRRFCFSILRIVGALTLVVLLVWCWMIRMPGKNPEKAATLTSDELTLQSELRADVQKLAGEIGERNVPRYPALQASADFIEGSFKAAGLTPRRDSYAVQEKACDNIEVEIRGDSSEIIVVGAHYDSVFGSPGANDNGTGVAAVLALARRFARQPPHCTLRFVAFVNEEPPYFQNGTMGSAVYAQRCHDRGDNIVGMISLETIGYFSDEPHSQTYPSPGLGAFYPRTGNFIGMVGNHASRTFVRRVIELFRNTGKLPCEGAALPAFIPGVSWSDQWSFWQHGYPALMVTDTAPFRYPYYHTAQDTPDQIDYARFTLVVSGMESVIRELCAGSANSRPNS